MAKNFLFLILVILKVEIIEVLVKAGDKIKKNDPIVTLESDKSSVEVPSPLEGKISELKVKIGDKVSEGSILATLEGSKVKVKEEKPVKEKIEPQKILNEDRTNGQIVKREKSMHKQTQKMILIQ